MDTTAAETGRTAPVVDMDTPYPPAEARGRAVLVQNITHAATGASIDDFFSFCGAIESKRLRAVQPTRGAAHPTLEAVVVFADDAARNTALMMNDSIIVDQPVSIVAVPPGYNFNAVVAAPRANAGAGGMLGDLGGFFSSFSSTVATECKRAAQMLDSATETGVLRQAKDGVNGMQQRTLAFASDIDDRYHVRNTLLNAAESSKSIATNLVEQTRTAAKSVDESLHITEKTNELTTKAMENETVRSAHRSITTGFQTLLSQTGIQPPAAGQTQPATTVPNGQTAPQEPNSAPVS